MRARRRLVLVWLAGATSVALTVATTAALVPTARPTGTQFGFTIASSLDEYRDPEAFTDDVDTAARGGQTWVRLGIASWIAAPAGDRSAIQWDEEALAVYDREIDYIRSRGMQVFLTTSGAPDWTSPYDFEDYVRLSGDYWSHLAERFAPRVAVWQVFNEADTGHYRTFGRVDARSRQYLVELARLLAVARGVVHRVDPSVVITTNSTGHPLGDEREAAWIDYFAALAGSLDAITLDLYPDDDMDEIDALPARVERAGRLGLPVLVGEIGMSTCRHCYSEQDQGRYVAAAIAAARRADPRMILVYVMRDATPDPKDGESSFGVLRYDGSEKAGFDEVLGQMQRTDPRP